MKVKITGNLYPNTIAELNLNNYIGEVVRVLSKGETEGSLDIELNNQQVTIYEGEYEIVEVKEDLENFMESIEGKYNINGSVVAKFMLEYRKELVDILR